ncbi:hypothetical protein Tco_1150862 [Tanacetum coccineum]
MGKVVKSILSRVVDNNIDVKNLFEGSKEGDEDMEKSSKDSSRKVENGRGDDTFGYDVEKVLGSMNEDDELLNQQKTQKGGVSKSVHFNLALILERRADILGFRTDPV